MDKIQDNLIYLGEYSIVYSITYIRLTRICAAVHGEQFHS